VTFPHRRAAAFPSRIGYRRALVPAVVLFSAAFVTACGGPVETQAMLASSPVLVGPSLTPVPGGSARAATPAPSIAQTESGTPIGRIWDKVPASFPGLKGSSSLEVGSSTPTSGTFAIPAKSVADAVAVVKAGLAADHMKVDAGSPLEDGSVVMEARGGTNPTCKIEVRFAPMSGTITMTVLYGATCPFN